MVEWEEYYLHLVPLVVEHPKILLSESKNLTNSMTKLYRASNDFIGDASLTVEQRSTLKLKVSAYQYWRTIPGHQDLKKTTKLKKSS